jgi:hypothetical protein
MPAKIPQRALPEHICSVACGKPARSCSPLLAHSITWINHRWAFTVGAAATTQGAVGECRLVFTAGAAAPRRMALVDISVNICRLVSWTI